MANDEKEYWKEVSNDADMVRDYVRERVAEGEDFNEALYEALNSAAENEAMYYWKARRILRWTDNEQAILDQWGEIPTADSSGSVFDVLLPIAYWAYREDVSARLEDEGLRADIEENPRARPAKRGKRGKAKSKAKRKPSTKNLNKILRGV